jgi:hypothetical protein
MLRRKREDVQQRHQEIHRLRRRPRHTLKAIAAAVGFADHTSVLHHLDGSCRCPANKAYPLMPSEGCDHGWKCTKCGASG